MLKPYSRAIYKQGLKARKVEGDGEESETLDRAMEYTGVVGVELVDMLVSVNAKVKDLAPRVPAQHTFGGDGLWDYIHDHQDCLEHLEGQFNNLVTMTENMVGKLSVVSESYH